MHHAYDGPAQPQRVKDEFLAKAIAAQTADRPAVDPLLLQVIKKQEHLINIASYALDRLRAMNNRVLGSRPMPLEQASKTAAEPQHNSMQDSINIQFSLLGRLLGDLSEEVDRANNEIA